MSSLSHRYRDFGSQVEDAADAVPVPEEELQDMQLASFDTGYQAGWEDAMKAQQSGAGQAAIDVAQNLQDMAFTHREAFLKLSAAMKPLLNQIVDKMLPDVARPVLGMHILTEIMELVEARADNAIEIAVAPANFDDVQALLNDTVRMPFTLVNDHTLELGEAYLRVNQTEREINLKAVMSGIKEALDAFYEQAEMEIADD